MVMTINVHKNSVMCTILIPLWNLCTVLIPLCKNILNLPMHFFLPCALFPPPLIHHVVMLASLLRCADSFACFYENRFCSLTINQTSFSQYNSWFLFIILFCRQENITEHFICCRDWAVRFMKNLNQGSLFRKWREFCSEKI